METLGQQLGSLSLIFFVFFLFYKYKTKCDVFNT